jgi:hypothetical protein
VYSSWQGDRWKDHTSQVSLRDWSYLREIVSLYVLFGTTSIKIGKLEVHWVNGRDLPQEIAQPLRDIHNFSPHVPRDCVYSSWQGDRWKDHTSQVSLRDWSYLREIVFALVTISGQSC